MGKRARRERREQEKQVVTPERAGQRKAAGGAGAPGRSGGAGRAGPYRGGGRTVDDMRREFEALAGGSLGTAGEAGAGASRGSASGRRPDDVIRSLDRLARQPFAKADKTLVGQQVGQAFRSLERAARLPVDASLRSSLATHVGNMLENYWLPLDVTSYVRVKLDGEHEAVVAAAVVAASARFRLERAPEEWREQLDQVSELAGAVNVGRDAAGADVRPPPPSAAQWTVLVLLRQFLMGVPMLDQLKGAQHETIFVLELSSYQLAELEVSPDIAIITNLYNDHTDYHGGLEAYWEAKRNIMRYMETGDTLIYNPEFTTITDWLGESHATAVAIDPEEDVDMSTSKLLGSHNKLNATMARHAAMLIGVDKDTCQKVIDDFEPIRHRLQKVAIKGGITYIDDAIGSNPEATIAGITTLIKEVGPIGCLFLGGQDRSYGYWPLMQLVSRLQIPKLVLFPETGAKIKALIPASYKVEMFESTDMKSAVEWAAKNCPKDSVCLLSTAAPSYSLWKDFEEKGDLFQEAVLSLPA